MTTTFDYEDFNRRLVEHVYTVILTKQAMYLTMAQRPDIIRRSDTLSDIITMFSLGNSITACASELIGHDLEKNIELNIKNYYGRTAANDETLGMTPLESVVEELSDMAYCIQPKLPIEDFRYYMDLQGLTVEDSAMIAATKGNDLAIIISAILLVIKSENMLIRIAEKLEATKSKMRGPRGKAEAKD